MKLKSCAAFITAFCMALGTLPALAVGAAESNIHMILMLGKNKVYVGGEIKQIDAANIQIIPVSRDNVIVIPLRAAAEALGAAVGVDDATGEIVAEGSSRTVRVALGSDQINVDGNVSALPTAVYSLYERTMVPAQAFAEGLGYKIFWNKKGVIVIGNEALNPNNEKALIDRVVYDGFGEIYDTYHHDRDYVSVAEYRSRAKFTTITKEMVKEKIAETGTVGTHPMLAVTGNRLDQMRKWLEEGDPYFTAAFTAVRKNADAVIVSAPIPVYRFDSTGSRLEDMYGWTISALPDLGFAYQLTGDKKYAKEAWKFIQAFLEFDDWGAIRNNLDAGVAGGHIAVCYDLIYDSLTKQQREQVEKTFDEFIVKPGYAAMLEPTKNTSWWTISENNWNPICNTAIKLGAYLNYTKNPDHYAAVIANSMNNQTLYMRAFEPLGQSEEGYGYFNYGLMYAEVGYEADYNYMGTDFGLTDTEGFKNAPWFPARISGSMAGVSIGDDPLKNTTNVSRLWLVNRFKDIALAKITYQQIERERLYEWRNLAFYDREMYQKAMDPNVAVAMPRLDNFVPAIDLVSFRENWTTKGNFISMHTGDNQAAHGHIDAGQVDIQANGIYWIMGSLGKDDYLLPGYFAWQTTNFYNEPKAPQAKPERNHIYRIRAESKTAVVIVGDGTFDTRPEQDEKGRPTLETIISKPKGAYAIADMLGVYHRDVNSYKRGIMMSNDRQVMTIQDEIVTKNDAATVWWLANTPANVKISGDGRSAMLEKDGQRMYASIGAPAEAKFKIIPTAYLPGEEFPMSGNTANTGVTKLAIELNQVAKTTISVSFIPLEAGQLEPAIKAPAVKPLSNWSIEDGPIISLMKPKLNSLKIDGEPVSDFAPDFYSYSYISSLPIDSDEMPDIEAASDDLVSAGREEDTVIVTVTDRKDANTQTKYYINVKKLGPPGAAVELPVKSVTQSGTHDGAFAPENLIDNDLDSESRWSSLGEVYVILDLGAEHALDIFAAAFMKGYERTTAFTLYTSNDKQNWTEVYDGRSGGDTDQLEMFRLRSTTARYVKFAGHGNSANDWNSVVEMKLFGK